MYKILLFLIAISVLAIRSFGQQFQNNAPCPIGSQSGPYPIDWTATYFNLNTISLGVTTIRSPFHLTSLTNPNVNDFSKYALKDYDQADGWELWKYDFGTPTSKTDVPYLILYNRHTSTIRVFAAFAQLLGQNNGINITLKNKVRGTRSAILENYSQSGSRHATENFNNNVPPVSNNNFYINQVLTWYHSDFFLHYDPCICNLENSLVLDIVLTNNANLNLTLDGQAIGNVPGGSSVDASGRVGESGILSGLYGQGQYSSIGFFRDLNAGVTFGKNVVNSRWLNIKQENKDNLLQIFGNLGTGIPIIGGVAKFFTSLLSIASAGGSSEPVRPLTFDINLKGNGTITSSFNYYNHEIIVPGSLQTLLSVDVRPYYNNPPGVFTLLKEPILEFYDENQSYEDIYRDWQQFDRDEVSQLSTDAISYVINPNAGFDLSQSTIKAQLLYLDQLGNNGYESAIVDFGCLNQLRRAYHKTEVYDNGQYTSWGWLPSGILLKVICSFKVANSTKTVPYVATFHVNGRRNDALAGATDQDITPNCSNPTPQATSATVGAVCSSDLYKNKVIQYYRKDVQSDKESINPSTTLSKDFIIYPNPASENFSIKLKKGVVYPEIQILIFDMTGRIVLQQTFTNVQSILQIKNISRLNKGAYKVLLTTKGETIYSSKLIKI